jgi:hypothetical protein
VGVTWKAAVTEVTLITEVTTEVTTADIRGLIFIFSAATMTEVAMCTLIVIADLTVVRRRTLAVADIAEAIGGEPHNSLDKKQT